MDEHVAARRPPRAPRAQADDLDDGTGADRGRQAAASMSQKGRRHWPGDRVASGGRDKPLLAVPARRQVRHCQAGRAGLREAALQDRCVVGRGSFSYFILEI